MKISKKTRYGLRAMIEIASVFGEGALSAKKISKYQDIPLQYLEQILNRLKRESLLKTIRGPKGGYILAKDPTKIKISNIVEVLESKDGLTESKNSSKEVLSERVELSSAERFWERLDKIIKKELTSTNLKDLCPKNPKQVHIKHNYAFEI